ncbi:hypothetical protein WUBG_17186, partial [Wuchereria bancrofti]
MALDNSEKMAKNISNELSQKNVNYGQMIPVMSNETTQMSQVDVRRQMSRGTSKETDQMSQVD